MHFEQPAASSVTVTNDHYRLRMSVETVRHYVIRFKLLEMGETAAAQDLPALAAAPIIFNEKGN